MPFTCSKFGEASCFPLQAISFLASFATFEEPGVPPQQDIVANRETMLDDIRILSEGAEYDSEIRELLDTLRGEYIYIIQRCVTFCDDLKSLLSLLPEERRKAPIKESTPHSSIFAVAYLGHFGTVASGITQRSLVPRPSDVTVVELAHEMLYDMEKIAQESASNNFVRSEYQSLQDIFDDLLNLTVHFKNDLDDVREAIPSLV